MMTPSFFILSSFIVGALLLSGCGKKSNIVPLEQTSFPHVYPKPKVVEITDNSSNTSKDNTSKS